MPRWETLCSRVCTHSIWLNQKRISRVRCSKSKPVVDDNQTHTSRYPCLYCVVTCSTVRFIRSVSRRIRRRIRLVFNFVNRCERRDEHLWWVWKKKKNSGPPSARLFLRTSGRDRVTRIVDHGGERCEKNMYLPLSSGNVIGSATRHAVSARPNAHTVRSA